MAPQIILSGITLEELQERIQQIVRKEVQQIADTLPAPADNLEPEFITRKETATILGISLPTLNEWTKSGIVPAHRIGTRVRYIKSDVFASLKSVDTIKYKRC